MTGPAPETRPPMIPSKGYWLPLPPDGKLPAADWEVLGEARCPGGCRVMYGGPLEELVKMTAVHQCGVSSDG